MKKRACNKAVALVLAAALALPLFPLAMAAGESGGAAAQSGAGTAVDPTEGLQSVFEADPDAQVVYIRTADDLIELARCCTLDTWSQGKTVVLQADLSLDGTEFVTIPTFGGTFEGNGHTISGLQITQSAAPAGLFAVVQQGAVIKELSVSGVVAPDGAAGSAGGVAGENNGVLYRCSFTGSVEGGSQVGGIAGVNALTGQVLSCSTNGSVTGSKMTGGVVGCNLGLVSGCENDAYVNTASVDPTINPTEIDLSFSMDFSKLFTMDTSMTSSDTGGIAGYSSGILAKCVNRAPVGYPHIGYNVGGVAGRSCGYVYLCENEASVYGRKDIGGITGQMEPYIAQNISETTLARLERQMKELDRLITKASKDADAGSGAVRTRLDAISGYLQSAAGEAGEIRTVGSIIQSGNGDTSISVPEINVGGGSLEGDLPDIDLPDIDPPGEGQVDLPSQIEVTTSLAGLSAAVSGMAGQMRLLNSDIATTSGALNSDLKAIQKQINAISDTALELFSASEGEGDVLVDSSETDPDAVTLGKAYGCTNSGRVNGDINVGGIAGAMAMEYELDPEDDVSSELDAGQRRKLEVKAIVQECRNLGTVEAKRNCAGGVCGRLDLGLITQAENYGGVTSESGEYVGGIAGLAGSTVRQCFAKCTLSGKKNVGGIVGSGIGKDAKGDSSTIAGCYSMVSIADCSELCGAISGAELGNFVENYFVSDTLTGINGRSYTGRAEPLTYEELAKRAGAVIGPEDDEQQDETAGTLAAPEDFLRLKLTFVVEEKTVKTLTFAYGDSFDQSVYPELPEKEGCYAHWDKTELNDLHFDTVVTAVYTPYVTALTGGDSRSDGRAIFFVQGLFDDEAVAVAATLPNTPENFENLASGLGDFLAKSYTERTVSREIVEEWSLTIPDDGQAVHSVRYLSPSGDPDHLDLYIKQDGGWKKAETKTVGSYLVFDVEGSRAQIAVISTTDAWWVWLLTGLLLAAVVLLIARLVRSLVPARRQRAALAARQTADGDPEPADGQAQPAALPDGGQEPSAHAAPKKKKRWVLPLVIVLAAVVCAAGAAAYFLVPGLRAGMQAYDLLKQRADQQPLAMALTVDAELGGREAGFTARLDRTEVENQSVTAIQQDGRTLYYCGDTIFLENGSAYRLNAQLPDYSQLLENAMELYRRVDFEKKNDVYTLTAAQDDAQALLELLLPSAAGLLGRADTLRVELQADGDAAAQLRFSGSGTLSDSAQTPFSVEAVLEFDPPGQKRIPVPEAVRSALADGDTEAAEILSEDVICLVSAWQALLQTDPLEAQLRLSADCGPLTLDDRLDLVRWGGETPIVSLQKNGYALYFTDTALCDQSGRSISVGQAPAVEAAKLLDIAYEVCMNGQPQRSGAGDMVVYTLALDEEGMRQTMYAIAPAARELDPGLESGSLRVVLRGGELRSLELRCSGTVQVALSDAAVVFEAHITFAQEASGAQVPQAVRNALEN